MNVTTSEETKDNTKNSAEEGTEDLIDLDEFRSSVPTRLQKNVTPAILRRINETLQNAEIHDMYRENLLSYTHVLREGRFKMTNYLDAVKYVSYKLMGHTNIQSYSMAFPEKMQKWEADGVEPKDVASYISAYQNSKLVMLIIEQSMIPVHVLNRETYQRAINKQAQLMMTAKSEKVQCDAANSLLVNLKPPENQKIELEITEKQDSVIDALRETTAEFVAQQRRALEQQTMTAQDAAIQKIHVKPADQEVVNR